LRLIIRYCKLDYYIDGADLIANEAIEQIILNGRLRSYGLEFYAKRTRGDLVDGFLIQFQNLNSKLPEELPAESELTTSNGYNSVYDVNYTFSSNYKLI
jgi:hypothetical protein